MANDHMDLISKNLIDSAVEQTTQRTIQGVPENMRIFLLHICADIKTNCP